MCYIVELIKVRSLFDIGDFIYGCCDIYIY